MPKGAEIIVLNLFEVLRKWIIFKKSLRHGQVVGFVEKIVSCIVLARFNAKKQQVCDQSRQKGGGFDDENGMGKNMDRISKWRKNRKSKNHDQVLGVHLWLKDRGKFEEMVRASLCHQKNLTQWTEWKTVEGSLSGKNLK